jgi:hypothetical protein
VDFERILNKDRTEKVVVVEEEVEEEVEAEREREMHSCKISASKLCRESEKRHKK